VGGWTSRPLAVGLEPTGGLALFAGVTARAGPLPPPLPALYDRTSPPVYTCILPSARPAGARGRAPRARGPSVRASWSPGGGSTNNNATPTARHVNT
jgi:hypothetical protein